MTLYTEYQTIHASDFNSLVGTDPTTDTNTINAVLGTGHGLYGLGQPPVPTIPLPLPGLDPEIVASDWGNLITAINNISSHQNTVVPVISAPSNVTPTTIAYISTITTNLVKLYNNKNNAFAQGISQQYTATANGTWKSTCSLISTISFSSGDNARYFFNAGGQISLNFSNSQYTNIDVLFQSLFQQVGTLIISAPSGSGTVSIFGKSFSGLTQQAGSGSAILLPTAGYYGLSNTPTEIFRQYAKPSTVLGVTYAQSYLSILASTNGAQGSNGDNGSIITITANIVQLPSNNTPVSVGTNMILTLINPETSHISNTWGTIVVATSQTLDGSSSPPSTDATLSNLIIASPDGSWTKALTPAFASSTTSYSVTTTNAVDTVEITPITNNSSASLTINGASGYTGQASTPITLASPSSSISIPIVVIAQDGVSKKTYTIVVTKAAIVSNDATLAGLALSTGTLSPTFDSSTTAYTIDVPNTVTSMTFTPAISTSGATILINGNSVSSGTPSQAITINLNSNTINIQVTARDNTTIKLYTITVNRASPLSADASLSNLTISIGSLSFTPSTLTYPVSIDATVASVNITPTHTESHATITVNGVSTTSGSAYTYTFANGASGSIPVAVVVTAQDGTTTNTYRINFIKPASTISDSSLSNLTTSVSGGFSPSFSATNLSYTSQSVPWTIGAMSVTPTVNAVGATFTVNGVIGTSGSPSIIKLSVGSNTINIRVTSSDVTTHTTYQIFVNRTSVSTITSSFWDKTVETVTPNNTWMNWGLLRCNTGTAVAGWGRDGTVKTSGAILPTYSGNNVNVIIIGNGMPDLNHPEFAVNQDGTGGSRLNQFNWFQFNSSVGAPTGNPGVYVYPSSGSAYYDTSGGWATFPNIHNSNKACMVASIVAGNTYGWAKSSNIYAIDITMMPFWATDNTKAIAFAFKYATAFMSTSPINPVTGNKNPTIIIFTEVLSHTEQTRSNIISTTFEENIYSPALLNQAVFNDDQLLAIGIFPPYAYSLNAQPYTEYFTLTQSAIIDDAVAQCISQGITVVGPAGDYSTYIDVPNGLDYNNSFTNDKGATIYYTRGSAVSATPNVICVGAMDSTATEQIASYSSRGPRVDLFAPGSDVMGALNSSRGIFDPVNNSYTPTTSDSRNGTYYVGKLSSTSIAAAQVGGIIASAMEGGVFSQLSPSQIRADIIAIAKKNQLASPTQGYGVNNDLQGAFNLVAFNPYTNGTT